MDFIENITWAQFFTNVIIVAVLYYITVILMYFRKALPKYLPKQFMPVQKKKLPFEIQQDEESEDIFSVASKASSAIKRHTRADSNKAQNKKELLFSLHLILQAYAVLRYTPFEQAISNLIASEVDDQFSFNLDDEELNSVWMG